MGGVTRVGMDAEDYKTVREGMDLSDMVRPQRDVEWMPVWDEGPEERPGDNLRIEDNTLMWECDGFTVALTSHDPVRWRAYITIPESVGRYYPEPMTMKCQPRPECGYVRTVEHDDDPIRATAVEVIIQQNTQPVFEVRKFIEMLLETDPNYEG